MSSGLTDILTRTFCQPTQRLCSIPNQSTRDPIALKQSLCKFRNNGNTATLAPANLFLAAGSDEVIDALIRCFCCPGHDTILICPPVYERYSIAAQINDVKVVEVPLDPQQSFQFQLAKVKNTLSSDPSIKLIFICSPGQPTGTMVSLEDIQDILLNASWNGVLIVDEAYIDFATERGSLATHVLLHPNLVVVQTLSKGFGLAGLRLGIAFASLDIAELLNNIRTPYNIGNLTIHVAMEAMKDTYMAMMRTNITNIRLERDRLAGELPKIRGVGLVKGELNANFLLFEVLDSPTNQGKPCNRSAMKLTESLVSRYGILVRYKGNMHGCHGSIRVTIGTEGEMTRFLEGVTSILESMYI